MDPDRSILADISNVVTALNKKIETLQAKVDELCKYTGSTCDKIQLVHEDLLNQEKEILSGTHIDTLREKE